MNEREFGRRVGQWLDEGTDRLDPAVASRLQIARKRALAAAPEGARRTSLALALAGVGGGPLGGARAWLATGLLLCALVGAGYSYLEWRDYQAMLEASQLDAELLADDLPVKALIDSGFDSWLKRSAEPQP